MYLLIIAVIFFFLCFIFPSFTRYVVAAPLLGFMLGAGAWIVCIGIFPALISVKFFVLFAIGGIPVAMGILRAMQFGDEFIE